MNGRQWRRHWRVSALGALLCLLAAVFAVEAKMGWYSPNDHVRVELSSTKLQATDVSRQVSQTQAAPAPVPHFPAEFALFLSFAAFVTVSFFPKKAEDRPATNWSAFSAPHFFRPPPRW